MGGSRRSNYTLGQLLLAVEGSEVIYEQNMRVVERIRQEHGSAAAEWFRINAGCQVWRPNYETMPGIDRIELLCDERSGAGLTPSALRQIRAEVCGLASITIQEADALGLTEVAGILAERRLPAKSKRRGLPQPDEATVKRDAQIAADWRRAHECGVSKAEFAKENGLSMKDVTRILNRVYTRKKRADK
jgi:hypothetical protein